MLNVAAQNEQAGEWRRSPGKWIAVVAALLLVVIALVWASRASGPQAAEPAAAEETLPLVSVTQPQLRPVTSTVTFIGALSARYDMPIGTEGEGGRIVAVLAEAGDRVKAGQ